MRFKFHAIENCDTLLLAGVVMANFVLGKAREASSGGNSSGSASSSSSGSSASSSSSSSSSSGSSGSSSGASGSSSSSSSSSSSGCSSSGSSSNSNTNFLSPASFISAIKTPSDLLQYCNAPFLEACRPPPDGRGKDEEFLEVTHETLENGFTFLRQHFLGDEMLRKIRANFGNGGSSNLGNGGSSNLGRSDLETFLTQLFQTLSSVEQNKMVAQKSVAIVQEGEKNQKKQKEEAKTAGTIKTEGEPTPTVFSVNPTSHNAAESSFDFFSRLLGLFELNNIDVELEHPCEKMFEKITTQQILDLKKTNPDEAAALELLLREKEVVMRCIWGDEMTGNFDVDEDGEGEFDEEGEDDDDMDDQDDMDCEVDGEGNEDGNLCHINDDGKLIEEIRQEVNGLSLEELLEKTRTNWPRFHGTGFCPLVARCNHSCDPNIKFYFLGEEGRDGNGNADAPQTGGKPAYVTNRLTAKTLRDIQPGEELRISYVDEDDTRVRRQLMLREYGFHCRCEKCEREKTCQVVASGKNGQEGVGTNVFPLGFVGA
jgi:hypothetical protein